MCGRFNILTDADALMTTFEILSENCQLEPFEKRYNISPTAKNTAVGEAKDDRLITIPIVRRSSEGQRLLQSAIWPLVPVWANSEVPKYSTANARSESMTSKPSFRNAWRKSQRCLIPATGFYEWQSVAGQRHKQPWHIYHREQPVMGFAGLWERGWNSDGEAFESCSIVTTKANQLMSEIHNTNFRMPVIVDPDEWDEWLGLGDDTALQMARTYPEGRLTADPISMRINNPHYNQPDCLERVEF